MIDYLGSLREDSPLLDKPGYSDLAASIRSIESGNFYDAILQSRRAEELFVGDAGQSTPKLAVLARYVRGRAMLNLAFLEAQPLLEECHAAHLAVFGKRAKRHHDRLAKLLTQPVMP